MLIKVSNDLSKMSVYAEGLEQQTILGAKSLQAEPIQVASFDNPILLTDTKKICELSSSLRDTVFSLYQSYPRTVSYDDISVSWSPFDYPRVWCPSIDTVFFARTLKRYLTDNVKSVVEIGCGSGYLIKYAIHYTSNIERAVASDINLEAIRCASAAICDEPKRSLTSFVLPDPDAPSLGLSGKFDLIITNPPYIPRPNENHDNPYEGLDLIRKLSKEADSLLNQGGHILINISSLSGDEPLAWFKENGWVIEPLETMHVPLKVNSITSNIVKESKDWLEYLKINKNLQEDVEENSGYRYWQELKLYDIHH
jgi:tRNA1(Val) A37 N6-methylase TrmN6